MNRHEKHSIASYNKKADNYDNTFDGRFTYEFKEQRLKNIVIPEGGKVLDIACGNCRLLNMLSLAHQFRSSASIPPKKMIEIARHLNSSMIFKTAGCDALPYGNEFFDVITVCAAFHHFPDI